MQKITRRKFLIKGTYIITLAGIVNAGWMNSPGFSMILPEFECKQCRARYSLHKNRIAIRAKSAENTFCLNCGADIRTNSMPFNCNTCKGCNAHKNQNGCHTHCWQIPFPNHKLVKNSNKPNFSITGLQFWCRGFKFLDFCIVIRYACLSSCFARCRLGRHRRFK